METGGVNPGTPAYVGMLGIICAAKKIPLDTYVSDFVPESTQFYRAACRQKNIPGTHVSQILYQSLHNSTGLPAAKKISPDT